MPSLNVLTNVYNISIAYTSENDALQATICGLPEVPTNVTFTLLGTGTQQASFSGEYVSSGKSHTGVLSNAKRAIQLITGMRVKQGNVTYVAHFLDSTMHGTYQIHVAAYREQ